MLDLAKLPAGFFGPLARNSRQRRVTPVSFAGERQEFMLSRQVESVLSTRARCIALVAVLWVFGLLNAAGIAWALSGRLDVEPYVADGSVFGCQPRAVPDPGNQEPGR